MHPKTHRTRRALVKQSWRKNLTTKNRQHQSRRHAKRPSPVLRQNQSGATRPRRNRNQRNPTRRRFRTKLRKRGNPNRREMKKKHRNRKKRRHPVRKSVLPRQNARRRHRKPPGLRRRRQWPRPSQKFPVLLQAASTLRS